MNATLARWAPYALALLRIMTALLFIEHGTAKLFGFPASDMRPAFLTLGWVAGVMEIVGGGLVLGRRGAHASSSGSSGRGGGSAARQAGSGG